jgi:hypothetical protein
MSTDAGAHIETKRLQPRGNNPRCPHFLTRHLWIPMDVPPHRNEFGIVRANVAGNAAVQIRRGLSAHCKRRKY